MLYIRANSRKEKFVSKTFQTCGDACVLGSATLFDSNIIWRYNSSHINKCNLEVLYPRNHLL
jgi:hypothetical protein